MKALLAVIGTLLLVIGVIWILQGTNILPGSFMTGQPFWAFAGLVCVVVGGGLLVVAWRRRNSLGG